MLLFSFWTAWCLSNFDEQPLVLLRAAGDQGHHVLG
jgi:hypothetical protein